ncbi:MAG: hypothetical protein M1812_006871 [Candelaria pacifica]|nr:MAG: hypothetical protein M1812_006871 [Candelaria pacifica]
MRQSSDKFLRHYSYECKSSTQERPYASRPSRTQQLLNPKLVPKLTSDVPNDLLRQKGIADEQLAKKEEERGRARLRDPGASEGVAQASRSRSISSYSSSSVSTISTGASRSPPGLDTQRDDSDAYFNSQRDAPSVPLHPTVGRKRRRRSLSSSVSYSSNSSRERRRPSPDLDRRTRRRRGSISPKRRGRRYSRSRSKVNRHRRIASRSKDRSLIARNRRSMTPKTPDKYIKDKGEVPRRISDNITGREKLRRYSNDEDHYGSSYRDDERHVRDVRRDQAPPPPRKERSLSPFSRRLAMTQAMNMGR